MRAKWQRKVAIGALTAAAVSCSPPRERLPGVEGAPACVPGESCGSPGGPPLGSGGPNEAGSAETGGEGVADVTGEVGVVITAELDKVVSFTGQARVHGPGPQGSSVQAPYGGSAGSRFTLEGVLTGEAWLFAQDESNVAGFPFEHRSVVDSRSVACSGIMGPVDSASPWSGRNWPGTMNSGFAGSVAMMGCVGSILKVSGCLAAAGRLAGLARRPGRRPLPRDWRALANRDNSVRPEGAGHQWRKVPPGELSVSSGS